MPVMMRALIWLFVVLFAFVCVRGRGKGRNEQIVLLVLLSRLTVGCGSFKFFGVFCVTQKALRLREKILFDK